MCGKGISLTVTSTTSGNLGVITYATGSTASYLTAVSTCGTWTIPVGGQGSDAGAGVATSVAYTLSLTGGCTTLSATGAAAGEIEFSEYSVSPGPAVLDAVGSSAITTACTSCTGVTLTLSGTSDVIQQVIAGQGCTAITGGAFTTPDFSFFVSSFGYAGSAVNTNNATAPTWTCTSSRQAASAVAFK